MLEFGNVNQYCVYKNLKVATGSTFKLFAPHCIDCKCTTEGLQCCGFGFAAGVVVPPEGCVAYNDACNLVIVKANHTSQLCQPSTLSSTVKNIPKLLIN